MFCIKCGEAIPDGSAVCPRCGVNLAEETKEQAIVYASQKESETFVEQPKATKKIPKRVMLGIAAVVCVIAVVFIINEINRATLVI